MGFILIDFIVDMASLGVHLTENHRVHFFKVIKVILGVVKGHDLPRNEKILV